MCLVKFLTEGKIFNVGEVFEGTTLQTLHVDSTLKRRGNGRFHVFSTWNPRGVFVGKYVENLFNLDLSVIFHINNFLYSKIPNTIC